jgi:hydroxymethylpyrimidine pyrophosphatase-like HAD family hydrolase
MRLLVSDLDRTLVFPARTLPAGQPAEVVEIYQGRGITVAGRGTLQALDELASGGAFVPVTTRSEEQLRRITPVWRAALQGWAICANGATLLHRGARDRHWEALVDGGAGDSARLAEARTAFERDIGSPASVGWMPLLRDCDGRFLYCTLVLDAVPADLQALASEALAGLGWRAVLHGRKLYALPRHICKGRALAHLRERLDVDAVMAAGDSLLDVELLLAAEERWCPRDAELVALGQVPAGTQITRDVHVLAGQQIAQAGRDWRRDDPRVPLAEDTAAGG